MVIIHWRMDVASKYWISLDLPQDGSIRIAEDKTAKTEKGNAGIILREKNVLVEKYFSRATSSHLKTIYY